MIYYINPSDISKKHIITFLKENTNIKFVSFVAVDLGNNRTDERIPAEYFIQNYDELIKYGIQTDGSSVDLPEIADIDNGKVDIIPDQNVRWTIDYSRNHFDKNNKRIGTLLIPSFLYHSGKKIGSRSVLENSINVIEKKLKEIFKQPKYKEILNIKEEIKEVQLTIATELEFWVYSPYMTKDEESLFVSQELKEQYWKRPHGALRKAIEESVIELKNCGLTPEMAHKEVGGVVSSLNKSNEYSHMEQVEIDWKYDNAMQSIDNEWIAKDIIHDVFANNGLDVTFKAKPIDGVAGSGEHHHIGIIIKTEKKTYNLFSPKDLSSDFLNRFGYGALMGMLKNYDLINLFISGTNDAFNRLKPGFEAPVCTVSSLGHSPSEPSRNRTVLIGLIKDLSNTFATRFELRSPNPTSNSYLLIAACMASIIEGIEYSKDKDENELLKEISKKNGEYFGYLEKDRMYRAENDIFKDYTQEQRNELFSNPPRTVYENISKFNMSNIELLTKDAIFTEKIIKSYTAIIHSLWLTELTGRIIPNNISSIKKMKPLHKKDNKLNIINWEKIYNEISSIAIDDINKKSLISKIIDAANNKDFKSVSNMELELIERITNLKKDYISYTRNIIFFKED